MIISNSKLQNGTSATLWHAKPQASGLLHAKIESLYWLLGIRRKVAFGMLLITLLIGVAIVMLDNLEIGGFIAVPVIIVYWMVNGLYDLLLRGNPPARRVDVLRHIIVPVDVVIITVAIYIMGGVLTPLSIQYALAILVSVVLLDPKGVYYTAAVSALLYCGLALLEANRLIPYLSSYWGGPTHHEIAAPTTYLISVLAICAFLGAAAFIGNRVASLLILRTTQIETKMEDMRTLFEIANGLINIVDEDEILRYLTHNLRHLQSASACVAALVTKEGSVEIRAHSGLPPDKLAKLRATCKDMPGLADLLQKGEPILVEDLASHPDLLLYVADAATKSIFILPIRADAKKDSKVLGAVCLTFSHVRLLTQEYRQLLETIAVQAGAALHRASLFCESDRLARQMTTLYKVGLYTGSTLSKDEVIKRTSQTIEELLSPDAYYIALFDTTSDTVSFEVFVENGQLMPKMKMGLDKGGLTGRIIQTCEPLLVQDWLADGQQYNAIARKTGADMLSYLGVPMVIEQKVVGVLSVQSTKPLAFNEQDRNLLTSVAGQTAMAFENARLHQVAQDQARLDSLTKVYNHGYFVERVRQAVADSDRDDTQVSLIMLDIDHFKQYNDTYGHMAGDNVLRMVANALKSSVRETSDFVGRWGGEEFCVLLQGVGLTEAKKVGRLIRRAIAELYPVDGHGHLIPNPTMSQGISSYPHPSATANELIEQADTALYQAKRRGRNQLIVYESASMLTEATTTTGHLTLPPGFVKQSPTTNPQLSQLKDTTLTTGHLV